MKRQNAICWGLIVLGTSVVFSPAQAQGLKSVTQGTRAAQTALETASKGVVMPAVSSAVQGASRGVVAAAPVVSSEQVLSHVQGSAATSVKTPSLRQQLNTQVDDAYREILRSSLRSDAKLGFDFKPEVIAKNKVLMDAYTQNFMRMQQQIKEHLPEIQASMGTDVSKEAIEYEGLLPGSKEVDVIYLGEVHNQVNVRHQIADFVSQLRSVYPDRNIVLATEFLNASSGETAPALIRDRETLLRNKNAASKNPLYYRPMFAALDQGIPLLALEDDEAIKQLVEELRDPEISAAEWTSLQKEAVFNFKTSSYGLQQRNLGWKKRIEAIRAQDPSALVVVWAGDRHVNFYNAEALPNLMPAKSFQLTFTTPENLLLHNAFFNGLYTQPAVLEKLGKLGDDGKVVHWWMERNPYNQLLGDVTVIVPDRPFRPSK